MQLKILYMIHPVRFIRHASDALKTLLYSRWNDYSQVVVLTDKNTSKYCLTHFRNTFVNRDFIHLELPGLSEKTKNLQSVEYIINELMDANSGRQTAIIALGGGVVTDTAGFAASIYKRGLHLYLIPTTLLGMVDAALGGKTGVNFNGIKNQVGSFYFPREVIIDPGYLATLPRREWESGYAEMIKHGLIADYAYFEQLIYRLASGKMTDKLYEHIIRSVEIKMRIIQSDFRESGKRKILNFGHTVGHALEACAWQNGIPLSHGYAVALGMAVETALSVEFAGLEKAVSRKINRRLLEVYPVPGDINGTITDCVLEAMKHDKKNSGGEPLFVLLRAPGMPVCNKKIPESKIREAIKHTLFSV